MTSSAPAGGLVLVVEDEPAIADLQRLYLTRAGFGVHVERDGPGALAAAARLRPAAVVLDVALPGLEGTEVLRRLRAAGDWTPVLLVTARDAEPDRLLGLDLGADDYLTKPFSPRELVARLQAVLRRSRGDVGSSAVDTLGPLTIDRAGRRVLVEGVEVPTTVTEFDLLAFLVRRPGRIFRREELLSEVWGYAAAGGTRTVDVHVAQVRAKLGAATALVRTVRGVGYGVELPDAGAPGVE